MHQVVVLEDARDQPEVVEDGLVTLDGPVRWDRSETATHVHETPGAQAPQGTGGQMNLRVGRGKDRDDDQDRADINQELVIGSARRKDDRRH